MEIDLELQEKDLFKELIWDGDIDQIAVWRDGEWSVLSSDQFQERQITEVPLYVLNLQDFFSELDFSHDSVERLIQQIEDILNGRNSINVSNS